MPGDKMWNVRNVSEEARRAAKVAAASEAMTLGKWIERAIGIAASVEAVERSRRKHEALKNSQPGGGMAVVE